MATSGRLQGYRWLHLRAIRRGYVVSQETMRMVIKEIDPEGVELRRVSGFCHFGLVLFMVLWQSPDTPIMSAFSCERAASSVLESRALSSACLVSCWSVVFGSRHSCFEFRSRDGVRTLVLHFLSLCECAVSSSLGTAHSCPRVFCCVARSLCFYRLRAFMLSCLVWTRGLWVFSLAACSCPVLHMAGDLFAGHVLVFLFCVSTWLLS